MKFVFDIDGTLTIVGDRIKHLRCEPKNWDHFYDACWQDEPNRPVVDLCRTLGKDHTIIYVTGRRESTRKATFWWLQHHRLPASNNKLLMRPDGDHRHDTEVKIELVKDIMDEIDMVFEDRNSMVKMWRSAGIPCMQVAEGDF